MRLLPIALAVVLSLGAGTVPAAVVDLTNSTSGVIKSAHGDVIFTTNFTTPTNLSDPFLSISATGTEHGYNTSARGGVFDTVGDTNRELQLKDLNAVTIGGAQYYSFVMALDESILGPKVSLDAVRIYSSATAGKTGAPDSLGTKRFDLGTGNYVMMQDDFSRTADVAFFIPTAAFSGIKSSDYIYMYQSFGAYSPSSSEWYLGGGPEVTFSAAVTPVPEATSLFPLLTWLGLAAGFAKLRPPR